jgi:hypothetical protein
LKGFMNTLVQLISTTSVDQNVKNKILSLIQIWGLRFKDDEDTLPLFSKVYEGLKNRKVPFPAESTVKVWDGVPDSAKPESERAQ